MLWRGENLTITRDRLEQLLTEFPEKRIAVIGDLCLDRYGTGIMEGIAREAPVPIVRLRGNDSDKYSPGGGANVCANVAALGPKTYPITVFGDDLHGFELTRQLEARDMDTRFIFKDDSRATPTFEKFFASAHGSPVQQVSLVNIENSQGISDESEELILDALDEVKEFIDALVIADYADTPGTWVVTESILERITELGEETDIPIVTDSRTRIELFKNTYAVPNEFEATVATALYEETMEGIPPDAVVDRAGRMLTGKLNHPCFVTRGAKAISVYDDDEVEHVPSVKIGGEIDTCGAGDTVDSGVAAALASDSTLREAAEIGDMAAKVTIKKIGTTGTATPDEILDFYARHF